MKSMKGSLVTDSDQSRFEGFLKDLDVALANVHPDEIQTPEAEDAEVAEGLRKAGWLLVPRFSAEDIESDPQLKNLADLGPECRNLLLWQRAQDAEQLATEKEASRHRPIRPKQRPLDGP